MKMGSKQEHDRIVRETLLLLSREAHHLCRAFNNPTGQAYRDHPSGWREHIHYGVVGSGDIYGFLNNGKIFFIEIKSGNAVQSQGQKNFEIIVKKFNGFYFVARSAREALEYIVKATFV